MFGLVLISWARGSIAKAKRRGERGQPCLVPLSILKESDLNPEYAICAFGLWYKVVIHLRKCGPNPHWLRIECR